MIAQRSKPFQVDLPFIIMGLLFIAMAIAEYMFPEGSGAGRFPIKILSGLQIIFALSIAVFTRPSALFSGWIPISFLILLFWLCFSGIIRTDNLNDTLYLWVMYFYWYSFFVFFYTRSITRPEFLQIFLFIALFSLLIWIPTLKKSVSLVVSNIYLSTFQLKQNYIGYYIVALFPFSLMLKKKSFKVITIALISFGTVYSQKRGAIFALVLMGLSSSLLYVIFVSDKTKRIRNISALISLWAVAIMAAGIFVYTNQEFVQHRLNQASNREDVYEKTFKAIEKAELYELIIGHGDRKAEKKIGGYTHNDWLFLIYDYGIIGVILMLNIYISLFWLLWKLCRIKSPLSLPLVSALALMTGIQFYSIGLYLKTFGFITGSFGLVLGCYYSEYNSKVKEVGLK